jgi:hypothetical protein
MLSPQFPLPLYLLLCLSSRTPGVDVALILPGAPDAVVLQRPRSLRADNAVHRLSLFEHPCAIVDLYVTCLWRGGQSNSV